MSELLNERALRKLDFTQGHSPVLADGQTWTFPASRPGGPVTGSEPLKTTGRE